MTTRTREVYLATALAVVNCDALTPQSRGQCNPLQVAKLVASDTATDDSFGISVAISGNTVVCGALHDTHAGGTGAGSAYVFVRSGAVWPQQAKLTASDAAAIDNFGVSVALSGNTALIGSYGDNHAGGTDAGSAYVFVRSGSVWTQQAKLIASDAAASDIFGGSVALDGNTALIGSKMDNHASGTDAGSAYVFVRSGTVWTQQAKLVASDAAAGDNFGCSVALLGNKAVIGSLNDDNAGGTNAGSAYVFSRTGTVWTQQGKLLASSAEFDSFGMSVAASESTALVGAGYDDHGAVEEIGSAYLYDIASTPAQQATLIASDGAAGDLFGISVALEGDIALCGATEVNLDSTAINTGAAYVYLFSGSWTQQAKLTADDAEANDWFGRSIAISGGTAVIGADSDDHGPGAIIHNGGSAYVFSLNCIQPSCDADCNGSVNPFDINSFLVLLGGGPPCSPTAGDTDHNGTINPFDISGFLDCLDG